MPGKSVANRPGFVLVCSVAAVLGTFGAWHFLEGPDQSRRAARAPVRASLDTAAETQRQALRESGGDAREQHRQYALAIERALASGDPKQRETAFAMLLPELLAEDPAAAVQMMNRQPPGETRDALRDQMARRWVVQDRESALSWLESLDADQRGVAAAVAVRTLAAQSPEQAFAAADRFDIGRDDGSLEYIAQIWAETDPAAARRWAEAQPLDSRNAPLRVRIEQTIARRPAGVR
jgi:hypothetical protein